MRRKLGILAVLLALTAAVAPGLGSRPGNAQTCISYGYLCDTRYVPPAPCCTGTSCYSPYPGVPKYCL